MLRPLVALLHHPCSFNGSKSTTCSNIKNYFLHMEPDQLVELADEDVGAMIQVYKEVCSADDAAGVKEMGNVFCELVQAGMDRDHKQHEDSEERQGTLFSKQLIKQGGLEPLVARLEATRIWNSDVVAMFGLLNAQLLITAQGKPVARLLKIVWRENEHVESGAIILLLLSQYPREWRTNCSHSTRRHRPISNSSRLKSGARWTHAGPCCCASERQLGACFAMHPTRDPYRAPKRVSQ